MFSMSDSQDPGYWKRVHSYLRTNPVIKYPYKVLVLVAGTLVFLAGVIMLVLPGPGILTMLLGLVIIGTEIPAVGKRVHRLFARSRVAFHHFMTKTKAKFHKSPTHREPAPRHLSSHSS